MYIEYCFAHSTRSTKDILPTFSSIIITVTIGRGKHLYITSVNTAAVNIINASYVDVSMPVCMCSVYVLLRKYDISAWSCVHIVSQTTCTLSSVYLCSALLFFLCVTVMLCVVFIVRGITVRKHS